MTTTARRPTHRAVTYCTSRGVETRIVLAAPGRGTHVLTASGRAIDVASGAAVAERRQERMAPALRVRAAQIVARVERAQARAAAAEEGAAAERMRRRRVANDAMRAQITCDDAASGQVGAR